MLFHYLHDRHQHIEAFDLDFSHGFALEETGVYIPADDGQEIEGAHGLNIETAFAEQRL